MPNIEVVSSRLLAEATAVMRGEQSKHVPENEIIRSPLQMPRVFNRLVELPIVKSTCERASNIYDFAKEKSWVAKVGLGATEGSLKAVGSAVKVTYTAFPSSGLLGSLKGGFEDGGKPCQNSVCKIQPIFETYLFYSMQRN